MSYDIDCPKHGRHCPASPVSSLRATLRCNACHADSEREYRKNEPEKYRDAVRRYRAKMKRARFKVKTGGAKRA